ncbi:MAG: Crp/Fnr family transcriptional regulator [Clostridia bacterium]
MKNQSSDIFVKNLDFFDLFSDSEKTLFYDNTYIVNYKKGKEIIESSTICQSVYFVLSGIIRVYKMTEEGKEITLYRVEPGSACLFTLGCIINQPKIEYEALTEVEQDAKIIAVPGNIFKSLITSNEKFLDYIFAKMLNTITELMVLTEEVTFHHTNQRLASYLLTYLDKSEVIHTTHENIARDLGTAREVISRMLEEFQKKGIVYLSRGKIKIIDIQKLYKVASM